MALWGFVMALRLPKPACSPVRTMDFALSLELPELQDVPLEERPRLLMTAVMRIQLLRLAMKGMNATEAAQLVGCSSATARKHYADPSFRREVMGKVDKAFEGIDQAWAGKKKSLHELIDEQAYDSFHQLVSLLQSDDLAPSVKVRVHQDFLNRCEESQQKGSLTLQKIDVNQLMEASKVAQESEKVFEMKRRA